MNRFSDQTIVLFGGTRLTGKSVRLATEFLNEFSIPVAPGATIGEVRVHGFQIPVVRTRGRGRWVQVGKGIEYSAS